jgi:hypothetical protein
MTADRLGGAVGTVLASAAVTALVGQEMVERLRGQAFRRYSCWRCAGSGRTDAEPTAVIAERDRLGSVRVRFAHARCAGSQVVLIDADAPVPMSLGRMVSKSAVLHYAPDPQVRPLLILEPVAGLSQTTASGERVNLWLAAVLDRGVTLLRSGGEFPRPAGGWLLQLAPGGARPLTPDGAAAFEGPVTQPGPWRDLVLGAGACVVLTGAIGLYACSDADMAVQEVRRLVNRAASAGELAGAVVSARVR